MTELRSCPFCGGEAVLRETDNRVAECQKNDKSDADPLIFEISDLQFFVLRTQITSIPSMEQRSEMRPVLSP